ncbi:MAG: SDR family oxidoreductase [Reichenbachiella sp.]
MELSLSGKSAFVCGSTDGIGKACALEIAALGANVVLVARNENKLNGVIQELSKKEGQVHQYIVSDFSQPEILKEKTALFLRTNESPVILVNNTGGPSPGELIEEDYTKMEKTFQAHIHCNHLLAQALVPGMRAKGYGRIVNVISTSVYQPIAGLGVSNTTRGAVASWAKTLSLELGKYGITVNNVLPGLTRTSRLDNLIKSKANDANVSFEKMEEIMNSDTPLGRVGSPSEIANMISFLVSPAAAYVNGVSIPVDGGRTGTI